MIGDFEPPIVRRLGVPLPLDGLVRLGVRDRRDTLVRVPTTRDPRAPMPVVVALHGAGGNPRLGLAPFAPLADAAGALLVAPHAREVTWDAVRRADHGDARLIGEALDRVADRWNVDTGRIALAGFSDGGSYALGLGLASAGVFGHVIAFSPGFVATRKRSGRPRLFVAHGVDDRVLPIRACSRLFVPGLRAQGYDVTMREFAGGHEVPPAVAREAMAWFLADAPAR